MNLDNLQKILQWIFFLIIIYFCFYLYTNLNKNNSENITTVENIIICVKEICIDDEDKICFNYTNKKKINLKFTQNENKLSPNDITLYINPGESC